jgi:hypothetical protein
MGASAGHVAPRRGLARERGPLVAGRPPGAVRPAALVAGARPGRSGARRSRPRGHGACAVGSGAGRPWPARLTGAASGARAPRAWAPAPGRTRPRAPGLAGARSPVPTPAPAPGPGATRAPARFAPGPGALRGSSGRRSSVRGLVAALRSPGGTTPRRRLPSRATTAGSAGTGTRRTDRPARSRRRGAAVGPGGVLRHRVIVGVRVTPTPVLVDQGGTIAVRDRTAQGRGSRRRRRSSTGTSAAVP